MQSMLHQDARLTPTARTLWEVQEFSCRLPVETATNLYTDESGRIRACAAKGEARRAQVRDGQSLRTYQAQARAAFLACLGGLPAPENVTAVQAGEKQRYGHFALEKVVLRCGETCISANVYTPLGVSGKRPAVLLTVGHTDLGKADSEYQYAAQLMAYAGFVCLVADPLGEGERFEHYEESIDFQPIQGCSGEHDLLDWKAKLLGQSLARYFIRDGMAALSYLRSREDVDADRIAVSGHSGGGTQTCMLMLAAGDLMACAAPCAYVTDVQAMVECGVDPDNEMLWPGSLEQGLDYVDFLAGIAPRPVLILSNQHDFFPREGTLRTLERARRLWQDAGSPTPPEIATACSGHAYPPSLVQAAARFFSRHLLGRDAELSGFAFEPLPAQTLRCAPGGVLLKAWPSMRTVHDEIAGSAAACREARSRLSLEEAMADASRALRLSELSDKPEPRVFAEGVCGHYVYRSLVWRPQAGYWNAGVLLGDMRRGDQPQPTVIALWEAGMTRLTEHANFIHRAVENGFQVLVMDVTGAGSLLPCALAGSQMYISWSTMYKLNAYLIGLGDSLFAMHTRQIVAALRMADALPQVLSGRTRLYALGEAARCAELASLITGTPLWTDGAYQPWEEIVQSRYHDQTNTHEWAFPGVLTYLDEARVRDALAQSGLLAHSPAADKP